MTYEWRGSGLRHSFPAFSVFNQNEETTSSVISQHFYHIIFKIFIIFHHTIFTYLDGIIFEITIFHNPHSHNPLTAQIGKFQLIPKSSSLIDSIKNPTLLNSIIITIISDRFHRNHKTLSSIIITITISDRFHQNHKIFQFPPAQLSLPPLIDSIAIKLSCTLHHHCQYSIINVNIFVIGANIFIIIVNISIIRIKTGNIWQFSAQSLSLVNSNKLYL